MTFRLLLLSALALLLSSTHTTLAAVYYVSPSGSGTSCTQSAPCSLTTGLSKPNPGDEVALLDGVYKQTMYIKRGGTSSARVVVRAVNARKAIVQNPSGPLGRVWANYVTVRGIAFDGMNTGGNRGAFRVGAGDETTLPEPVHHVILEDLWVHNTRAAGIIITTGEHDVIVRRCLVESTGHVEFWGEAFYLGSKYYPDKTVYNLEIYDNTARGFTENALEAKKYSHHFSIHDNVFSNQVLFSDYGGDPAEGNDGTVTLDGHSHTVYDNILRDNKCGIAVFLVEPEANIKIYNNIAYNGVGPAQDAIRMKNWGKTFTRGQYPPSQVYNNTFYKLVDHNVGSLDPSILTVRNNIGINLTGNLPAAETSATMFANAPAADFRLVSGCVAVDKANAAPYSATDFAGRTVTGAYRDFGAYEYYAATAPSRPTGLKVISVSAN